MTISPCDEKNPKRRGLTIAVMFLALFFAVIAPSPAKAVNEVDCATCNINSDLLFSELTAAVSGFFAVLEAAEKYLMTEGFSGVIADITSMAAVQIKALELTTNGKIAADYARSQAAGAAILQGQSVLPNKSRACAVVQYQYYLERLGARDFGSGAIRNILDRGGTGINADNKTILKQHIANDLCQLGLIPTNQYGTLTQNCPQAPNNPQFYQNLIGNISVLLNEPQLALAKGCVLQDNYVSFAPGAGPCINGSGPVDVSDPSNGADPSQDKRRWAAFALICEMMHIQMESPVSGNRAANANDWENIVTHQLAIMGNGIKGDPCVVALGERTACPSTNDDIVASNGESCHTDQVQACQALTLDPNQLQLDYSGSQGGGQTPQLPPNSDQPNVGLGYNSDPLVQNNCQNGLSILAHKKITSHCNDTNALLAKANDWGTNDELSKFEDKCSESSKVWDDYLQQEKNALATEAAGAANLAAGDLSAGARNR